LDAEIDLKDALKKTGSYLDRKYIEGKIHFEFVLNKIILKTFNMI